MTTPPCKRGRRRGHNPNIPGHIDQSKLPDNIYFDHRGRGNWYTLYTNEGGRRVRENIATAKATLAELHKISADRQSNQRNTLHALGQRFMQSDQFLQLARQTQDYYRYGRKTIEAYPTRLGKIGDLEPRRFSPALIQRIVDAIAQENRPSKANAALTYLRRVFRWGMNRDYCSANPASGVEPAKERKRRRLPEAITLARLAQFCEQRGQIRPTGDGSLAPYLWAFIEISYLCRLRLIETLTLTDANAQDEGVLTNRRKRSRNNVVAWSPRLREAWAAATAHRAEVWRKRSRATPMTPANRPLFVSRSGDALSRGALTSAWRRMMLRAIEEGVITDEERFGIHDLKRRGITDTQGNRHDKQEASGHLSSSMLDIYDLSVPIVKPSHD